MIGEPTVVTYQVANISESHLMVIVGGDHRNRFGRSERFKVTVTNDKGEILPVRDSGLSFGGMYGPKNIASMGRYTEQVLLSDWAIILRVEFELMKDPFYAGILFAIESKIHEGERRAASPGIKRKLLWLGTRSFLFRFAYADYMERKNVNAEDEIPNNIRPIANINS